MSCDELKVIQVKKHESGGWRKYLDTPKKLTSSLEPIVEVEDEPSIRLNEQQSNAVEEILDFCVNPRLRVSNPFFCLAGYAGTGKTTSIQFLLKKLIRSSVKVACTAPTNKATKVLRQMAKEQGIDVPCMTIHSMLGLSIKEREDKEELEKVSVGHAMKYQVIIIDEASMINKMLFGEIVKACQYFNNAIIFVGDPAQLPPVGEINSEAFTVDKKITLTQIVRQAEENPLIALSKHIRECIKRAENNEIIQPSFEDYFGIIQPSFEDYFGIVGQSGVISKPSREWLDWFPTSFQSEQFKKDHDSFRIIAWTNQAVDQYNYNIHKLLYPDNKDTPFAIGEIVTFKKPVKIQLEEGFDEVVISTDQEAVVESIDFELNALFGNMMWKIKVSTSPDIKHTVWYLDPSDRIPFQQELKQIASEAKRKSGAARKEAWKGFWALKNLPAEISMCYAITAHKSQGSTFENVFIDIGNMQKNQNFLEYLKLLYVSITRAKHAVVLG